MREKACARALRVLEPSAAALAAAAHMEAALDELVANHRQFKGENRNLRYVHKKCDLPNLLLSQSQTRKPESRTRRERIQS